jgi:type I restriction enzyme S subunit
MGMNTVWETASIGDVCRVVPGYAFKSSDWKPNGIPVVKIRNITGDNFVDLASTDCVSESLLTHRLQKYLLKDGDILVAMTGATAGKVGRVRTQEPLLLNQRVAKIAPLHVDPDFIWSVVSSQKYQDAFFHLADGAAQPNMSGSQIEAVEIPLPPLPIQRRIAGILSAYDDLIENCQRRIKILEEMARRLYREWFVYFRYPGHEGCRFVESPLGEIPEGWEVKTLAELCTRMESGGTPKRSMAAYWENGEINWYKTGELWDGFLFDSHERISLRGQRDSTARLFEPGTILMAIYGSPTVGRMGILMCRASCNQAAIGLVANKSIISQEYLFHVLYFLRDHFNSIAQGAAQQNISKEKVANAQAVLPPRHVIESFDVIAKPTFVQIRALQQQIQNLRRTRDLLLPRLLSGLIDIESLPEPVLSEP